jgi:nitroreductase
MSDLTPDELLTTTRSVRRRLDLSRPVPLDIIRECLRIALQAPSGSNRQHWHWLVVTDPSVRASIGGLYRQAVEQYLASSGSAARLFANDPQRARVQRRVQDSVAYLGEHMAEVPVLVIPCLDLASRRLSADSQADIWASILPATWSYMLAARTRGLGTAWTTLHLDFEDEVAAILNLPDGVRQAAMIPTAYVVGDRFHPAARQPLAEVMHLNRW